MRVIVLDDHGRPVDVSARVLAMFDLIMEHHSDEIAHVRQGWLELHWDGNKVHSSVKRHGGLRMVEVKNPPTKGT